LSQLVVVVVDLQQQQRVAFHQPLRFATISHEINFFFAFVLELWWHLIAVCVCVFAQNINMLHLLACLLAYLMSLIN